MHLLSAETYQLKEFIGADTPGYAILSHRWGDGEVSFQDVQTGNAAAAAGPGYRKLREACRVALSHGFRYIWIDTCCIDKTSSAELSEAIIPCTAGTGTPSCASPTSTTSTSTVAPPPV